MWIREKSHFSHRSIFVFGVQISPIVELAPKYLIGKIVWEAKEKSQNSYNVKRTLVQLTGTFFCPKLTSSTRSLGTRSWSCPSPSSFFSDSVNSVISPLRLPLTQTTFLGQSQVCNSWLKKRMNGQLDLTIFFHIINTRIEHLQKEEPFSSDPYFNKLSKLTGCSNSICTKINAY